MQSSELEDFAQIIERAQARDSAIRLSRQDYDRLIGLALGYIEPRHRLSLIDPALEQRVLRARRSFMDFLPQEYDDEIEFYDPERVILAAPIRDNLLFGRVAYGISNSEQKVGAVLKTTLTDLGLLDVVYRLGLDYDVGPGGKLLFGPQRVAVNLARCIVRRPDTLIVDGSLADFSANEVSTLVASLLEEMQGRTLIMAFADRAQAEGFDRIIEFDGVRVSDYGLSQPPEAKPTQELEIGE